MLRALTNYFRNAVAGDGDAQEQQQARQHQQDRRQAHQERQQATAPTASSSSRPAKLRRVVGQLQDQEEVNDQNLSRAPIIRQEGGPATSNALSRTRRAQLHSVVDHATRASRNVGEGRGGGGGRPPHGHLAEVQVLPSQQERLPGAMLHHSSSSLCSSHAASPAVQSEIEAAEQARDNQRCGFISRPAFPFLPTASSQRSNLMARNAIDPNSRSKPFSQEPRGSSNSNKRGSVFVNRTDLEPDLLGPTSVVPGRTATTAAIAKNLLPHQHATTSGSSRGIYRDDPDQIYFEKAAKRLKRRPSHDHNHPERDLTARIIQKQVYDPDWADVIVEVPLVDNVAIASGGSFGRALTDAPPVLPLENQVGEERFQVQPQELHRKESLSPPRDTRPASGGFNSEQAENASVAPLPQRLVEQHRQRFLQDLSEEESSEVEDESNDEPEPGVVEQQFHDPEQEGAPPQSGDISGNAAAALAFGGPSTTSIFAAGGATPGGDAGTTSNIFSTGPAPAASTIPAAGAGSGTGSIFGNLGGASSSTSIFGGATTSVFGTTTTDNASSAAKTEDKAAKAATGSSVDLSKPIASVASIFGSAQPGGDSSSAAAGSFSSIFGTSTVPAAASTPAASAKSPSKHVGTTTSAAAAARTDSAPPPATSISRSRSAARDNNKKQKKQKKKKNEDADLRGASAADLQARNEEYFAERAKAPLIASGPGMFAASSSSAPTGTGDGLASFLTGVSGGNETQEVFGAAGGESGQNTTGEAGGTVFPPQHGDQEHEIGFSTTMPPPIFGQPDMAQPENQNFTSSSSADEDMMDISHTPRGADATGGQSNVCAFVEPTQDNVYFPETADIWPAEARGGTTTRYVTIRRNTQLPESFGFRPQFGTGFSHAADRWCKQGVYWLSTPGPEAAKPGTPNALAQSLKVSPQTAGQLRVYQPPARRDAASDPVFGPAGKDQKQIFGTSADYWRHRALTWSQPEIQSSMQASNYWLKAYRLAAFDQEVFKRVVLDKVLAEEEWKETHATMRTEVDKIREEKRLFEQQRTLRQPLQYEIKTGESQNLAQKPLLSASAVAAANANKVTLTANAASNKVGTGASSSSSAAWNRSDNRTSENQKQGDQEQEEGAWEDQWTEKEWADWREERKKKVEKELKREVKKIWKQDEPWNQNAAGGAGKNTSSSSSWNKNAGNKVKGGGKNQTNWWDKNSQGGNSKNQHKGGNKSWTPGMATNNNPAANSASSKDHQHQQGKFSSQKGQGQSSSIYPAGGGKGSAGKMHNPKGRNIVWTPSAGTHIEGQQPAAAPQQASSWRQDQQTGGKNNNYDQYNNNHNQRESGKHKLKLKTGREKDRIAHRGPEAAGVNTAASSQLPQKQQYDPRFTAKAQGAQKRWRCQQCTRPVPSEDVLHCAVCDPVNGRSWVPPVPAAEIIKDEGRNRPKVNLKAANRHILHGTGFARQGGLMGNDRGRR
ncbi:unnamed protein product [Amoebophrya sp. A120]|nr:unnamed protein product [Amoebophrya sp. A120]|eukprot:GSA120T00012886001.1